MEKAADVQDKVDRFMLQKFVPLKQLSPNHLSDLAGKASLVNFPPGKVLFKVGYKDDFTLFLLEGEVVVGGPSVKRHIVKAGTRGAERALSEKQPYLFTCVTRTQCTMIRINRRLLDVVLTWDQSAGVEVTDITSKHSEKKDLGEETGDWMTGLVRSKAFMRLPPANLQVLFSSMKEINIKAGRYIIRQGESGDYYYLVKRGRCEVLRQSGEGPRIKLAELQAGDAFGEEALLSNSKRNASVRMLTDSVLMRLPKKAFNDLLKPPLLHWVSKAKAKEMVRDGAVWVDVRLESEHKGDAIGGSLNIPLFMLRLKADILDRKRKYIMYCDSGRRSSVAAFLLNERGVQAYCLRGGLNQRR